MNSSTEFGLLRDRAPRYLQVADILIREISEGQFPVGTLLPPEPQLCQRFAVSRHTLWEAVRLLCEQGLLSRQQGVGTHVLANRAETRYVASLSSLRDLMAYTQQTTLKFLGSRWVNADESLERLLRCDVHAKIPDADLHVGHRPPLASASAAPAHDALPAKTG